MKAIVTGARGQLGSDLCPLLSGAGFEVAAFSSADLDITDQAALEAAIEKERPGVIVNCAAYTKVDLAEKERDRAFAVNSEGALNLARAAKRAGAAVVHISTDFVFSGEKSSPYVEDDPTGPLGVYGESKLSGEAALAANLGEHVIIRTSWLYGASGANFVKTVLRLASEREHLRIVYDQAGTPTWTRDLADAVTAACRAIASGEAPWGTYHYSNEGVASWYDLAVEAVSGAAALGVELRCKTIEPIRTSEYPTPARRPAYSVLDKAKIKRAFGIRIPHWRGSLMEMLKRLERGSHA